MEQSICQPRDEDGLPRGRTQMHAQDSITRRIGGDVRSVLMAGSVFTLQVAHPLVGAGVAEHSAYKTDPWSRLRDIDASGRRFLWRDEASAREEGARLRFIHRDIKGTDARGKRYHALDPHGYGWVHTVFLDLLIRQTELYGDALTREEEARLFVEWYEGALFLGLRDKDLPQSLEAYRAFFDHACRYELEQTSVVEHLLTDRIGPPKPRAFSLIPDHVFGALWKPLGVSSQWLALAGLPPAFRARLTVRTWTAEDDARFERVRRIVRAVVPRVPERARMLPDARRARFEAGSRRAARSSLTE